MLSGNQVGDCAELVGSMAASGEDCETELSNYFPMMPSGASVRMMCCKTCSNGAGSDPVTGECAKVHDVCSANMANMMGCDACDFSGVPSPDALAQCTACVQKSFGDSYKACSCCMLPIFEEMAGGPADEGVKSVLNKVFPCDA